MYNDLQGLGVDVAELKLKANTAIAFMDNFLVIDRSHCKTAAKERTVLAHEAGHYLSEGVLPGVQPLRIKGTGREQSLCGLGRKVLPELCHAMACGFTEPGSWPSILT